MLDFLNNQALWLILIGVGVIAWSSVSNIVKKLPFISSRSNFIMVAVAGFLVTSGIIGGLGSWGTGSAGSLSLGNFEVSDIQVTTSGAGNCTISNNNNVDDLMDVRCTDVNVNENTGITEMNTTILTVTRTGSLEPVSCNVVASTQRGFQSEVTPGDGSTYTILEVTTLGQLEAYVQDGAAATYNSPKESTSLTFADGVATRTLGLLMEVDEGAHDNLNQYSYRDVLVDVCGRPFTVRIHRMD